MLAFWAGGAFGNEFVSPVATEEGLSGGWWEYGTLSERRIRRKPEEIESALEVIQEVALRQSKSLLTDEQKIYDELSRELELKGLKLEAKYLETLNSTREMLITLEIKKLLKKKIQEEDEALLMLIAMNI